jgi:hypothetical protein
VMAINPFKDPNCAMCRWWIPRDGERRNHASKGTCTALHACTGKERDTVGWQACALFDRLEPSTQTEGETG